MVLKSEQVEWCELYNTLYHVDKYANIRIMPRLIENMDSNGKLNEMTEVRTNIKLKTIHLYYNNIHRNEAIN